MRAGSSLDEGGRVVGDVDHAGVGIVRVVGVRVHPGSDVVLDLDVEPRLLEHLAHDGLGRMLAELAEAAGRAPHVTPRGMCSPAEQHVPVAHDDPVRAGPRIAPVARAAARAGDGRARRQLRSARRAVADGRHAALRAEDEDDVRATELAAAHPVERRHEPDAEVLAEPAAFAGEAGPVHHDAPRDLSAARSLTTPIL